MRVHSLKLLSLVVMTASLGVGAANAKPVVHRQAAQTEANDPAATPDSHGMRPASVALDRQSVDARCQISREEVPVIGGGLEWRTVVDCPMD